MCEVSPISEVGVVSNIKTKPSININLAHKLLGHHGEVHMHEIVKALGITITQGSMNV